MAFSRLFTASIALLSLATSLNAVPIKRWDDNKYEPYDTYHTRYNALNCKHKHNTPFFKSCCGPLHNGQSLDSRPAECNPDASSNSTVVASSDSVSLTPVDDAEGTDDASSDPTVDDDDTVDANDDGSCPDGYQPVDDGAEDPSNSDPSSGTTTFSGPEPTPTPDATSTTKTHHKSKSSTEPPAPTADSNDSGSGSGSGSGDGDVQTGGKATFFLQEGGTGACGEKHSDSDFIAAIDQERYGNPDEVSPLCGRQVKITRPSSGKTVTVTIVDDCPSCLNKNSIDLSKGAFLEIATVEEGEVDIDWVFIN